MWLLPLNQDDTEFIPPREVEEWDVNGCLSLFRYYRAACERWQVGNVSLVALQLPKVGNVAVCCFVAFQTEGVSCQIR